MVSLNNSMDFHQVLTKSMDGINCNKKWNLFKTTKFMSQNPQNLMSF